MGGAFERSAIEVTCSRLESPQVIFAVRNEATNCSPGTITAAPNKPHFARQTSAEPQCDWQWVSDPASLQVN